MKHVPILLPELGTSGAAFSLWYVRLGDEVLEGDRVAEVLIPGATIDVPAPASGRLAQRHVRPRDSLQANQCLGAIETEV